MQEKSMTDSGYLWGRQPISRPHWNAIAAALDGCGGSLYDLDGRRGRREVRDDDNGRLREERAW